MAEFLRWRWGRPDTGKTIIGSLCPRGKLVSTVARYRHKRLGMSRAQQRGAALRQQLGLRGQVDAEAVAEGLVTSWEVAEHFGMPDEMVRLRAPSISANTAALRPTGRSGRRGPSDA